MLGRGVRSETDTCESYILDHSFTENLWARNRGLFPTWFKDGLDWRFDVRSIMGPVAPAGTRNVSNAGPAPYEEF